MSNQIICDSCGRIIAEHGGVTVDTTMTLALRDNSGDVFEVSLKLSAVPTDTVVPRDICFDCSWKALRGAWMNVYPQCVNTPVSP